MVREAESVGGAAVGGAAVGGDAVGGDAVDGDVDDDTWDGIVVVVAEASTSAGARCSLSCTC